MKLFNRHFFLSLIMLLSGLHSAMPNGLRFKGSEHLIDERTSYDVFGDKSPVFSGLLNISFDISLLEPSHFGYIVRIKNNEPNNTYNLSYYIDGASTLFKFNKEGGKNLITVRLKNEDVQRISWFKAAIIFNRKQESLTLSLNNHQYTVTDKTLPEKWQPDICFGRSEYLIDVPSFAIKQLKITDNEKSFIFPLNERKDNVAHDVHGNEYGHISNPVWLINSAYYWSDRQTFKSGKVAGYNFDTKTDNLYIFNQDSLTTYNLRTGNKTAEAFSEKCPIDIFLGTNFLDSDAKKLYVYEVCNERKEYGPNVAVLDLTTKKWSVVSYASIYMQLHHHSVSYDQKNKRYFIFGGFGGFGGFGNMQYSKSLFSYNFMTNRWDSLELKGDRINPRYFSSMGYKDNSLYIYGGMGNESGEQVVGRRYFYDLHKIDLRTNKVSKLWEIQWTKENIVPVRQMVLTDSCLFTLCYPEHFSKTFLKLYRFSLKDGSFKILGDSIPIRSEKIKTKANIYYSTNQNCLYAVIQEFDNFDISSSIRVYSLAFPPISLDELASEKTPTDHTFLIIGGILLLVVAGAGYWIIRKRKNKTEADTDELFEVTEGNGFAKIERLPLKPSSIYLFGEFRVHDRKNKDITYMFSSKLKQAFLIILEYSTTNGISSQRLSELLWPDKPEDKVKNSRGVTINHLRRIMKELDGIELIFEKGLFKIIISPELCYCDYLRCLEIIKTNNIENNIAEFIDIIRNGKFLKSIDMPEFDTFKENVEKTLEPSLLVEAERNFNSGAHHLMIILCDAIFSIDPINEEAIYYVVHALNTQRLTNEAKKKFFQFTTEYKKMMGKEYPLSFNEIINQKRKSDRLKD